MRPEEYITVEEACERFGVSRSTLYRRIPAPAAPRRREPGDPRVRLRLSDIQPFLAQPQVRRRRS